MDGADEKPLKKQTSRYAIKTRSVSESIEDSILTFVLQDESKNTLISVSGLSKLVICEKSSVISALLCGGFAESTQQIIYLRLPEELLPIPEHIAAWAKFWKILNNTTIDIKNINENTDNEIYGLAIMANMYNISSIITIIINYYSSGVVPINTTTLYTANILNCVEKLICPPNGLAPNNNEIPKILSECVDTDDAFLLMHLWSSHQLIQAEKGLPASPFLDITDEIWPAMIGIPITTNSIDILNSIIGLSQLSLSETVEDLITYLATYQDISFAGGSVLHAASTHSHRGKGATDIDIWIHRAKDDTILRTMVDRVGILHNMLIGNNNSVMTIIGCGLSKQIQLIHTEAYDVRNVIASFDTPAVQIGLQWNAAKSCVSIYCTIDFLDALRTGKVSWWNMEVTRPARMRKYVERGFSVPPEYEKFVPGPHDKCVILAELKGFTFSDNPSNEHEKTRLEITAGLMNPLLTDVRYVTTYAEYLTTSEEHITKWIENPLGQFVSDYNSSEQMRVLPNDIKIIRFASCKLNTGFCTTWYFRNFQDTPDKFTGKLRIMLNPDNKSFLNEITQLFRHDGHITNTLLQQFKNTPSDKIVDIIHTNFICNGCIRVKLNKNCKIIDTITGINRQTLTIEDTKRPIRIEGYIYVTIGHNININLCATTCILGPCQSDML